MFWGCPDEPNKPNNKGGAEVEPDMGGGGEQVDMEMAGEDMGGMPDAEPVEPDSCELDSECFPGRICAEGACADAECQRDADCSPERPVCYGPEGEEPSQRRGRCGHCASDDDCFGASACLMFEGADELDGVDRGGLCVLEGACEGSLECSPSSRLIVQGSEGLGAASGEGEPVSEVCVDRTSSERDPSCELAFDCRAGMDCPEGLRCLPSGQCAPAALGEGCEQRSDCGFGEVCLQLTDVCGPCQNDSECGSAQRCVSGACLERPGACSGDDDCLGARVCGALGDCSPPQCEEDAFGLHESLDEAVEISGDRVYRGLMSCADDVFSFSLPAATSALIAVRQRDRGANLGLQVLNDEGDELGRSTGGAPVEAVRLLNSPAPRTIFVRIFQEGPQSKASYDLEIHYAEALEGACFDDPFELSGGDDSLSEGRLIRASSNSPFPSATRGQICAGDVDVLCFELARDERLTIKGSVELGDALIVGRLFDPDEDEVEGVIGRWSPDLNPSDIDYTATSRGRYCLSLESDNSDGRRLGQGRYRIELNAVSPDLAQLCEGAEPISLEQGRGGVVGALSGSDVLRASCASDSDSAELAYTVDVTNPSLLVARVSGLPSGTLGDPVISLRARCDQTTSELACSAQSYDVTNPFVSPPNPAVLRAPVVPPVDPVSGESGGRYTLLVDGVRAGDSPEFQVDVELRPLAPAPDNDRCDQVTELSFNEGVAVVEASLDQADHSVESCAEGGPDVFYTFTLEERSDVLIQASSKPAEFPVIVSLSERCGGPAISCGFGVQETLEAGTYHLTLAGVDAQARGLTELQVSVSPLPSAPENDACSGAIELVGLSGSLSGDTRGASADYNLSEQNLCTRYNSSSADLAYRVEASAGVPMTFTVTPELGWDASIYLLRGCDGDVDSDCTAGQDGALTETLRFTPSQSQTLYLIVDGANGEAGPFTLDWVIGE